MPWTGGLSWSLPAAPGRGTTRAHQIPGPWPVSSQARGILISGWGLGGRGGAGPRNSAAGQGLFVSLQTTLLLF